MAKLLRLRRGTTAQHGSFTGAEGEVTVDTTKDTLVVHDNATAGGRPMLREDLNNMPNSGVTAGTYGSSSAIPSITVDAKGRVTSATTSAIDSTAITNGTSNVSVAASGNITVTRGGALVSTFTGSTVDHPDGIEARFGTGNDLRVYHDGTNSHIHDNGTGDLIVRGENVLITNVANSRTLLQTNSAAASVTLFNDTTARLATTNTGIDVTGTVACDGLDCDGAGHIQSDNVTQATPLTVHNGTSGGNTRLLVSSFANGSGDPFIMFDAGGVDMSIGLFWESGANKLRLGPGTSPSATTGMQIDTSGHCLPTANNSLDLGSSSLRWRNIYTNDLNLSNEGGANDVDGTWGSWTIQEGEDELFLLNRRNGKKYKFALQEVN